MRSDPTVSLRHAMARHRLRPKSIIWDGRFHRFPGQGKSKGDSGWYIAYPERTNAVFGDWSAGLKQMWKTDETTKPDKQTQAEWKSEQKRRDEENERLRAQALKRVSVLWANARKDDATLKAHGYVQRKGIDHTFGNIRISDETTVDGDWTIPAGILLVPMIHKGKIVNVQRIDAKPDTPKKHFPHALADNAFHLIGGDAYDAKNKNTVYVTEGWATGWTIHQATGCTVLVAFYTGGLKPAGQWLAKNHKKAQIVFAADNDRWSTIQRSSELEAIPNPGVHFAQEAAEAVGAKVAIPEFDSVDEKPTDFDDLRQREGLEAVRRWLDPGLVKKVVTETPDADRPARDTWQARAPFECLGHNRKGDCIYLAAGQILTYPVTAHGSPSIFDWLCSEDGFWEKHFPPQKGQRTPFDMSAARKAIMRECKKRGVFSESQVRGRGAHRDENGDMILHLGDRVLAPGHEKYIKPSEYDLGGMVLPVLPRLSGPSPAGDMMTAEEGQHIQNIFETRPWMEPLMGPLAAGFTVVAPLCGWYLWRAHLWLSGYARSGKTSFLMQVILPLLADMKIVGQGQATEAGIRQMLQEDALPVIIDEPEAEDRSSARQVKGIVRLARSASMPIGKVLKGSQHGKAISYEIRSSFLLSSVSVVLQSAADRSRWVVCELQSPHTMNASERAKEWAAILPDIQKYCTFPNGRRLIRRTAGFIRDGRFEEILRVMTVAVQNLTGDQRAAQQYGLLLTGYHLLGRDDVPDEESVIAWLKDLGVLEHVRENEPSAENEAESILSRLMQKEKVVRDAGVPKTTTLAELIESVLDEQLEDKANVGQKEAKKALARMGFKVNRSEQALCVANNSEWVGAVMADTPYRNGGWQRILRGIQGAERKGPQYYHKNMKCDRSTSIPFAAFRQLEADPLV